MNELNELLFYLGSDNAKVPNNLITLTGKPGWIATH